MGILSVTPVVAVRDIGIDTNLFNDAVDPKSDFTFIASPEAKASLAFPVGSLTFGTQVDFVYFQTYERERAVNTDSSLAFEMPINRLRFRSTASYLNARRRQNSEIDARVRGTEADVIVGAAVQVSGLTTFGFETRMARIGYNTNAVFDGEALPSRLNRDELRFRTSFRYSVTPLTTLVANGDVERWRFELSPLRDANSFRIFPGVEFDASALLSGRAYVGYRSFDSLDPDLPGFKGLVASGDLTYTIREATRLSVDLRPRFDLLLSTRETVLPADELDRVRPAQAGKRSRGGGPRRTRDTRLFRGLTRRDDVLATGKRVPLRPQAGLRTGTVQSHSLRCGSSEQDIVSRTPQLRGASGRRVRHVRILISWKTTPVHDTTWNPSAAAQLPPSRFTTSFGACIDTAGRWWGSFSRSWPPRRPT